VAVGAVLAFHTGFGWARGGFLGVSTFFTLSGFLITTLLLTEATATGRIRLRAFWARRFRRLLPAAMLTLGGIVLFGALVADANQLRSLRGDVLAALADVANWRFVFTGNSYADLFAKPSPVQHFWSLAIEEQFYATFPVVVAGVVAIRRRPRPALFVVLASLAAVSITLMFVLRDPGRDVGRVYYGTDTRAVELLAGALLAIVSFGPRRGARRRPRPSPGPRRGRPPRPRRAAAAAPAGRACDPSSTPSRRTSACNNYLTYRACGTRATRPERRSARHRQPGQSLYVRSPGGSGPFDNDDAADLLSERAGS